MLRAVEWMRSHPAITVAGLVAVLAYAAAWQVLLGLSFVIGLALMVVALAVASGIHRAGRGETPGRARLAFSGLAGAVVVALAIQAVPYGRSHDLPPASAEPAWDSPRTRELAKAACFDCHSNEVEWPWYSAVAPFSWAVQRHVDAGRDKLNYQEWDRPQEDAHESAETVEEGSMPPLYYRFTHPGARLTASEKAELIRGLEATFGREDDRERGEDRDDD